MGEALYTQIHVLLIQAESWETFFLYTLTRYSNFLYPWSHVSGNYGALFIPDLNYVPQL